MESILDSIKKLLGPGEELTHFDPDIIMHINTVLMALRQIGVGPATPFTITDGSSTWNNFLGENNKSMEAVKTYVYLKVKLMFDPPQSSIALQAMNDTIKELEYRLYTEAEYPEL